jgi:hypothetical protein
VLAPKPNCHAISPFARIAGVFVVDGGDVCRSVSHFNFNEAGRIFAAVVNGHLTVVQILTPTVRACQML